jgi:hypothetical protein
MVFSPFVSLLFAGLFFADLLLQTRSCSRTLCRQIAPDQHIAGWTFGKDDMRRLE